MLLVCFFSGQMCSESRNLPKIPKIRPFLFGVVSFLKNNPTQPRDSRKDQDKLPPKGKDKNESIIAIDLPEVMNHRPRGTRLRGGGWPPDFRVWSQRSYDLICLLTCRIIPGLVSS